MAEGWGRVYEWIALHPDLSYKAKAVYTNLAVHAHNRTRTASLFQATIARETGLSLTSVKAGLKELRAVGVVTWDQRLKDDGTLTSSIYRLHEAEVGRTTPNPLGAERLPLRRVAAK